MKQNFVISDVVFILFFVEEKQRREKFYCDRGIPLDNPMNSTNGKSHDINNFGFYLLCLFGVINN